MAAPVLTREFRMSMLRLIALATLCQPGWLAATAADSDAPLGIAAKYPGDAGIEKDADVLYFWDYENESDWRSPWEGGLRLYTQTTDPENVRFGKGAIEAKLIAGSNGKGDVIRLPEGRDVLYQRYYAKYPIGFAPMPGHGFKLHGFAGVAADKPSWYAQGTAGIRPTGEDKMYAIMIQADGDRVGFYHYHPHQRGKWGDEVKYDITPALGTWRCYEFMMKVNDIGQSNGAITCWVDGKQVGHVDGLQWRTVDTLKINLILDHVYNKVPHDESAYFDNRVVATKYIGPLATEPVKQSKIEKPKAKPTAPPTPAAPAIDVVPHRNAIVQALKDTDIDQEREVSMVLFGRVEHVSIVNVDDRSITVSFNDNAMQVPWQSLGDQDMARIALAHLPGDADALFHAGALAVAGKKTQLREQITDILWRLDSERAKALKELR
jgi:hypothetical protein